MKKLLPYILILLLLSWHFVLFAQDRFPRPEFQTAHPYPANQMPAPRALIWQYFDLIVLIGALSLTTWLALKKRSRQGLIWMSVFSLAYFGFYRQGCICSVGSVQNVSLALFNSGYSIPLTALLFFIIPLLFALAFGRVFCAGVCPFGAIQELTGIRPAKLPRTVEIILGIVPFIYLALSILFSATGSQFIICRYDPYVGIFRLDAPYTMVIFVALLIIAGLFINRPYCRFFCPYGVLLNIFSRFSWKHLSITPAECTNCRLCENVCPYDAILPSGSETEKSGKEKSRNRFLIYLIMVPVFTLLGAFLFYNLAPVFSGANNTVRLAREIRAEKKSGTESITKDVVAFKESGKTEASLFKEEEAIIDRFRSGSVYAGAFLGISLGIGLISLTVRKKRDLYEPHKGKCYSCGRCFKYCPIKAKE